MLQSITQPLCCSVGNHVAPTRREPHGPVVETCPCCGKTVYYFGLSLYGAGLRDVTVLSPINFPRVLNAMQPAYATA